MNPGQVAAVFGLTDPNHPDLLMLETLAEMIGHFGRDLPAEHQLGKLYPWQRDALREILKHERCTFKGCAQATGKTSLLGLLGVASLLLGASVGAGMPSLKQGKRILGRRIDWWMASLERRFGLKREISEMEERVWNNGAILTTITSNPDAQAGVHGYPIRTVLYDEGEMGKWVDMGNVLARTRKFSKMGLARVVVAGYGGEEDSVIEMAPEHGWPQIVFDDQRIIEYDEALRAGQSAGDPQRGKRSWREEFAIAQADHPESYDQLYRCLRVTSNGRLLFQNLKEFAACPMPGAFLHRGAGIDVGVDRDETVLTISEHRGPVTNYLPSRRWRRTPVMALARELVETLVPLGIKPHDCGIEINGPGSFLADAMLTFPAMHGLNRITMQDQPYAPFKTSLVKGLIDDDLRGFIGMASRQDRAEASRVSYTVSNGLYKVEHCDLVSSMIVGRAARLRVIAA